MGKHKLTGGGEYWRWVGQGVPEFSLLVTNYRRKMCRSAGVNRKNGSTK